MRHPLDLWPLRTRCLLLAALMMVCGPAGAEPVALPATRPPALDLTDLAGKRHALDNYRGQVVLVNFWASWCSPCLREMPGIKRLAAALQARPFRVLGVNAGEKKSRVWQFSKLLTLDFPVLLDVDGTTTRAWGVDTFPTTYIIDAEGLIRYRVVGAVAWDEADWRQKIEALLPDQ